MAPLAARRGRPPARARRQRRAARCDRALRLRRLWWSRLRAAAALLLVGARQFTAACTPDDDVTRVAAAARCCGGCGGCWAARLLLARQLRRDCCWRRLLLACHAVEHRLRGIKRRDGRVAAVDEDCRARRQQKPAHGLQLGGRDAQLLLLLLHCSAIFPVRLSAACVRQGVAHAVQAARRAGEARVGRVDFFRVRAIFASAARAFFPTRGNFGNHIFSGVLVPIISQEGSGF